MQNSLKPLVSILMPVYNGAKFMGQTIENLLKSSYDNIEIIIVDDGSTDDSFKIASRYSQSNSKVKVFQQENAGAGAARNRAFHESAGEYCMYMDCDDLISPNKISRQVECLREADASAIASCAWVEFTDILPSSSYPLKIHKDYLSPLNLETEMLNSGEYMQTSCWMVPRHLISSSGGWNSRLSINDDGAFFAKILSIASKVIFCGGEIVYYRRGHESLSTSDIYAERKLRALLDSYEEIQKILLTVGANHSNLLPEIRCGLARNYALVMCKAPYHSAVYNEAKAMIRALGLSPKHPHPTSQAALISNIIGLNKFLKLRSLCQKIKSR